MNDFDYFRREGSHMMRIICVIVGLVVFGVLFSYIMKTYAGPATEKIKNKFQNELSDNIQKSLDDFMKKSEESGTDTTMPENFNEIIENYKENGELEILDKYGYDFGGYFESIENYKENDN